jgi:hypothetical protein
MILVFERAKTVHALHRAATVIGGSLLTLTIWKYEYSKPSIIPSNYGEGSSGLVKQKAAVKDKTKNFDTNKWKS